jgi:hypothetical protein
MGRPNDVPSESLHLAVTVFFARGLRRGRCQVRRFIPPRLSRARSLLPVLKNGSACWSTDTSSPVRGCARCGHCVA